jgi:uncharacterized membrane protein (UPF0127 family)
MPARLALLCVVLAAAAAARADSAAPPVLWVPLGGESFRLELALDPETRQLGLSGRPHIAANEGMLFVFPRPRPLAMVMRDCPVPIDVVFVDASGVVVAVHEMRPETPRGPDESRLAYEARLPQYPSPVPAQLAIEVAGGRLRQLGIEPGDRIALDTGDAGRLGPLSPRGEERGRATLLL